MNNAVPINGGGVFCLHKEGVRNQTKNNWKHTAKNTIIRKR